MANGKIIQFMGKLIDEYGVNVLTDPNYTKKWRYIVLIMVIMLADVSLMMEAFVNFKNLGKFIQLLGWIGLGAIVISKSLMTLYHEKTLCDILDSLNENNEFVYPDERLFNVHYSWYLEEEFAMKVLRVVIYGQFMNLLFFSLPGFINLLLFGKLRLVFPGYLPWPRNNLISCWLTLLYQLIQCSAGLWMNFLHTLIPIVVTREFLRQFEKLRYAVCTLEYRSLVALEKYKNLPQRAYDIKYEDILRENIISCFKHHRILRKNFQIYSIWFNAIFSCELIPTITTFACGIVGALIDHNFARIFIQIMISVTYSLSLLSYCFIGEIFSDLNESITDAMFYEWTLVKMNKSNRRLAFIFHMMVDRPFEIFGCFIFKACLFTYARIVRNIFSYFNVFKATINKRSI